MLPKAEIFGDQSVPQFEEPKVRGAREPELEKDRLRLVLDEIIVGLVTTSGS